MTPDSVGPLSRPFSVRQLPGRGTKVVVEATPEERAALAADLGLPSIESLVGDYQVTGTPDRVRVRGRLQASVIQTCVVTLEDFTSQLEEEVEVEFAPPSEGAALEAGGEFETNLDAPDELIGDRIDLGAITAEFLALSLDPYPRKPGAELPADQSGEGETSPFSALAGLVRKDERET